MALRSGYDGDAYFSTLFNCIVHLIMYSYYQCTTLEIPVPKPIKKMVTNLQMIQFISMNIQAIWVVFICDCKVPLPHNLTLGYLVYIFSLLVLFKSFSSKEYKDLENAKPKLS